MYIHVSWGFLCRGFFCAVTLMGHRTFVSVVKVKCRTIANTWSSYLCASDLWPVGLMSRRTYEHRTYEPSDLWASDLWAVGLMWRRTCEMDPFCFVNVLRKCWVNKSEDNEIFRLFLFYHVPLKKTGWGYGLSSMTWILDFEFWNPVTKSNSCNP